MAEGNNSKIMSIKRQAGGYSNIENFKKKISFYCDGLDPYHGNADGPKFHSFTNTDSLHTFLG